MIYNGRLRLMAQTLAPVEVENATTKRPHRGTGFPAMGNEISFDNRQAAECKLRE